MESQLLAQLGVSILLCLAGFAISAWSLIFGAGLFFAIGLFAWLDSCGVSGAGDWLTLLGTAKLASCLRGTTFVACSWKHLRAYKKPLLRWSWPLVGATILGSALLGGLEDGWIHTVAMACAIVVGVVLTESGYREKGASPLAFLWTHPIARLLVGLYIGVVGVGTGLLLLALLRRDSHQDVRGSSEPDAMRRARFVETVLALPSLLVLCAFGGLRLELAVPYAAGSALAGLCCARWIDRMELRASPGMQRGMVRLSYLGAVGALFAR